jgi:SAM-dependent methyltransferase
MEHSLIRKVAIKAQLMLTRNPLVEAWLGRKRRRTLTRQFIESEDYTRMMMKGFDPEIDGANSAELRTRNFNHRHFKHNRVLGAWRWLGVYENRAVLTDYVFSKGLEGLDLGGARGPISLEVDICDRLEKDIFNRPVRYSNVSQIPEDLLDYVWSSHTLEHIEDLDAFIGSLSTKLKPGGKLITLVPAYTCTRWRAGRHEYADARGASNHLYTFCLAKDTEKTGLPGCVPIDELIGRHLRIDDATMAGDNSIFIVATR